MARREFIGREERSIIAMLALHGHNDAQIAAMCGRERSAVSRTRRRLKMPRAPRVSACIPEEFADDAKVLSQSALSGRYRRSVRTIRRWFLAVGVQRPAIRGIISTRWTFRGITARNMTPEEAAVMTLRKHFPNVFRCDIRLTERGNETFGSARGLPERGRNHWYIAKLGIVERDAMMQIAANLERTPA